MLFIQASAFALVAGAAIVAAQQNVCDKGVVQGSFCLSDCQGDGVYVDSPPLITGIALPNFQLDFNPADPYNPKASASNILATLAVPPAFAAVDMHWQNAGSNINVGLPGQPPVGNILTPDSSPASGDSQHQSITLGFSNVPFALVNNNKAGFADFMKQVTLASGNVEVEMNGSANTQAYVTNPVRRRRDGESAIHELARRQAAPELCLNLVPFDVKSTLIGFGGLTQTTITGLPVVQGGSASTGIKLQIPLTIHNPSNVVLNANTDAIFDLVFNNAVCGSVILPNIGLKSGDNAVSATSFVFPDPNNAAAVAATRALLTQFTGGKDSALVVKNGRSSNMPSLDAAFAALSLPQTLPSNKSPLINTARFTFPNIFTFQSTAGITAYNPFASPVAITHMEATLSYHGGVIGTISQDVSGFTLPASGTAKSPGLSLKIKLDLQAIEALLKTLGGGLKVDVASSLTVNFGGYSTVIDYNQSQVPTSLVSGNNI
ncbi:hypothetical protein HK101_007145 [Irineochytrium annulatum]|nr:hypothetical protein HK101_007145 [Irineochytrium annulatum]